MASYTLSALLVAAAAATSVYAQDATSSAMVPLASKHFSYPDGVPYQADTDNGIRGTQSGYNRCNSTTEGEKSMCQTAFINSIDDFCLWAPPNGPTTIGETEHEEVAWCTKPGRGTRLIPAGALQGVQFMKTPDYMQVVGFIDQTKINLKEDDTGGELDPHGADFRGNPLGGLVYSNGFPSNGGKNDSFQQVIEWHNFMGGGQFCFKVCDPAGPNAARFCEHIYDRIGCLYNAPNRAQKGEFTSCEGANQDFPGIFTDESGAVQTFTQPPESLGAISTMPYQPNVPSSSNCVTYSSEQIFATATASGSSSSATASGSAKPSSGSAKPSGSASRSGSAATASSTGEAENAAGAIGVSVISTMLGVAAAITFLA